MAIHFPDPHVVHLSPIVTDPTIQVAIIGIITTFITTAGVVIAAMVNNRRERSSAADLGIAATLRERLALRDEQLADLREDKATLQAKLGRALEENEELRLLMRAMRSELEALKHHQEDQ